jgi:hypothetical protein
MSPGLHGGQVLTQHAWHAVHGMPCSRASSSTCSILVQACLVAGDWQ